jgi:hypothetical protein
MFELTGIASLLRAAPFVYWGAALIAVFLAIKLPRGRRGKAVSAVVVVALFGCLPAIAYWESRKQEQFAEEAWSYFKKKCDAQSGQKIYKIVTDVDSVLILKPLPPATEKDLFDQFWYGDPYSNATPISDRGMHVSGDLIRPSILPNGRRQEGLKSVEVKVDEQGRTVYRRIVLSPDGGKRLVADIQKPVSRFGVTWEDTSTPEDRRFWVAGSRLRVIDLADNSVVAERIGFFIENGFGSRAGQRHPWLTARGPNTTCPSLNAPDYEDQWFVLRALRVIKEK